MTSAESICYTLINCPSVTDSEPVNESKLKYDIEHGDVGKKTEALKTVILMILNGEKPQGDYDIKDRIETFKIFIPF